MSVHEYKVLSPVLHQSRKFTIGETIVLSEAQAASLPAHCLQLNLPGSPAAEARAAVASRVQRLREEAGQRDQQEAEAEQ